METRTKYGCRPKSMRAHLSCSPGWMPALSVCDAQRHWGCICDICGVIKVDLFLRLLQAAVPMPCRTSFVNIVMKDLSVGIYQDNDNDLLTNYRVCIMCSWLGKTCPVYWAKAVEIFHPYLSLVYLHLLTAFDILCGAVKPIVEWSSSYIDQLSSVVRFLCLSYLFFAVCSMNFVASSSVYLLLFFAPTALVAQFTSYVDSDACYLTPHTVNNSLLPCASDLRTTYWRCRNRFDLI